MVFMTITYFPIKQIKVLLNKTKDTIAVHVLMQYMRSAKAEDIIKASGYDVR
jgi:hypothetical protein